jgi:predicted DNA-binding transcriptional regulator AlpA
MSTEQQIAETLWTVKEVADYLRASTSWVYQKATAGLIPHLPALPGSRFLRFEPSAIRTYARGEWQPRT